MTDAAAELPAPFTPASCDLTDYRRMPLDVGRLLGSDTWGAAALETRMGFALMSLWAEAWRQIPAGSLPDNDARLYRMSMLPDRRDWAAVRQRVRDCFTVCSDGRLYHDMVCEMALECWLDKLHARRLSLAGNAKRHNIPFDTRELDAMIDEARTLLQRLNPLSQALRKQRPGGSGEPSPRPRRNAPVGSPGGSPAGTRTGFPPGSQVKEREGITPQSPPATACGQLGLSAPGGAAYPCDASGWPSTRKGVEAIGLHVGIGQWDEAAQQRGEGETFAVYELRVRQAMGWMPLATGGGVPIGNVLKVVGQ